MTYDNENAIKWLEKICDQRFGSKTKIELGADSVILYFINFNYKFIFDVSNSDFQKDPNDISYFEWDANKAGLDNPLGVSVPTIGLRDSTIDLMEISVGQTKINFDFLGMVYFTLGRIEELVDYQGDIHERFRFKDSHAHKHGYIERPFIDEWYRVLCQILYRENLIDKIPECDSKILLSHDVDRPAKYAFTDLFLFAKTFVKDVINHQYREAIYLGLNRALKPRQFIRNDPYNTFDYLMRVSEQAGLKSTFYFLAGKSSKTKDADYFLRDKEILRLIKNISDRGHYIGLHPSYNSCLSNKVIEDESSNLSRILGELGVNQNYVKSRMHYLKFKHPYTYRYLCNSGIRQNSTMGFAEHAGFRAGTCWPYPVFDPLSQIELPIEESPLIAMDVSLYGSNYMNLKDHKIIQSKLRQLYETTNCVGGRFEFLWHNSNLRGYEAFYENVVPSLK